MDPHPLAPRRPDSRYFQSASSNTPCRWMCSVWSALCQLTHGRRGSRIGNLNQSWEVRSGIKNAGSRSLRGFLSGRGIFKQLAEMPFWLIGGQRRQDAIPVELPVP